MKNIRSGSILPVTTNLQYDDKGKPVTFVSLNDYFNVSPPVKEYCCRLPEDETYKQVYITDDETIYNWASKMHENSRMFRLLKQLYRIRFFKYLLDEGAAFNSVWQDVLHVDDIIGGKNRVYVEDTLILNCQSIETYEKVIPFICGPYKKLILHGKVTYNQVVQLMHADVRKTRINAKIEINSTQYSGFIRFIRQHAHGLDYKLFIYGPWNYHPKFETNLSNACRQTRYRLCSSGGTQTFSVPNAKDYSVSLHSRHNEDIQFSEFICLDHSFYSGFYGGVIAVLFLLSLFVLLVLYAWVLSMKWSLEMQACLAILLGPLIVLGIAFFFGITLYLSCGSWTPMDTIKK